MNDIAVKVAHVSKSFKLPHERTSSIKSAVVNFYKKDKYYESQQVLKDVSFEVQEGDFFAIVGRNGSGKSTLLKLLAGIYSPSVGEIHVRGKLTPFIELGVGFNPELTGKQNVFLNGALLGFDRKEMEAMYEDIVAFAELENFMDLKFKNYSSGMQVRLAFSIAIRAESDILLLDEVLAVGDAAFQQKCFDYFEELKKRKKTVVFVSHDMGAVRRFCNKAIYIKEGRVIHQGTPAEVSDIYIEENIDKSPEESVEKGDKEEKYAPGYEVSSVISWPKDSELALKIKYKAVDSAEMYVGISLQSEGISFAEITTSLTKPLKGTGSVTFTLDTSILNGGGYQIGVGLFKLQNRELLAISKNKNQFTVKGSDNTRGAAIRLADTWEYTDL